MIHFNMHTITIDKNYKLSTLQEISETEIKWKMPSPMGHIIFNQ